MNIKEEMERRSLDEIIIKKEEGNRCNECGLDITDKFLLKVGIHHTWHLNCLRCSECLVKLQNFTTCYYRNQKVYCRRCYCGFFSRSCSACNRLIGPTDWVRHAKGYVYHLACFSCDHCKRQLSTGEEFALSGSRIRCRTHFHSNTHGAEKDGGHTPNIDDYSSTSSDDTMTSSDHSPKPKRIRTTFTEQQLEVLHAHFKLDVNPDSSCLQNIAQITGLSKRVTQVWFQNSRARQKKYTNHRKICHVFSEHGGKNHDDYQAHIKMET